MNHTLRTWFYLMIVRPIMRILVGRRIELSEQLPKEGPAILVANHNSHLDVFALMYLLGFSRLRRVRPVAAADYFMTRPLRRWFATRIVGIIPIDRTKNRRQDGKHPLEPISEALANDEIVILFPEGTRGEPERMSELQPGAAHLARRHPDVPVIPVFMRGFGLAMPKGESVILPYRCEISVGNPLPAQRNKRQWTDTLKQALTRMAGPQSKQSNSMAVA